MAKPRDLKHLDTSDSHETARRPGLTTALVTRLAGIHQDAKIQELLYQLI